MIKRSLHLRDIILLALIGIIFGVIYFAAGFVYNGLTIASMPHPIMADTTGAVTYAMDFKITVDTFSK